MANVLSGRVALVTGVSRDGQVGQAVAQALAAEGALLGIAARTRENVEARAEELRGKGARVPAGAATRTVEALPIRAVLHQDRVPIEVYWTT